MIVFRNVPKISVMPRLGWYSDPPKSGDWQFSETVLASTGTIAPDIDLSMYFRPVSDQMQFASCVANATVDVWEAQTIISRVASGTSLEYAVSSTPDLSRMFVWWNARNAMYPPQTTRDSGTYNRLAMDSIARFGICTESRWPYIYENATRRPSLLSYRDAISHRCEAFYNIAETGPERIQLICRALSSKQPVVFGTLVDKAFFGLEAGSVWSLRDESVGGHAMAIVGYSLARKAFKVRNSWSDNWCADGYCWISEEHMQSQACASFWVPTRSAL